MYDIFFVFTHIFILLAPFSVLSVFVALTEDKTSEQRRRLAIKSTSAIFIAAFTMYLAGEYILKGLGLQLPSFQIGAGLVLFLSGIEMVRGTINIRSPETNSDDDTLAVVPIAIPCAIGPGTVGALLVMRGDLTLIKFATDATGIIFSILLVGLILFYSDFIEHIIKHKGLVILSKLTGLFLTALSIQIIVEGIKGFFPNL